MNKKYQYIKKEKKTKKTYNEAQKDVKTHSGQITKSIIFD